jgi:hypothetical protein
LYSGKRKEEYKSKSLCNSVHKSEKLNDILYKNDDVPHRSLQKYVKIHLLDFLNKIISQDVTSFYGVGGK